MPLPSVVPPSLGGEISTGTFLDGWFGPTVAGSVTVVTGPPYAGVTTLLRHIATQIGYHTPALFMTTNTTCPRPDEQASHLSWMTPAGGRGGSLDWTFAALMALVKERDDLAPVWVLDDAEQLDGPLDQLGSRAWGWAHLLPVLQKANVTLFIGMKTRNGADGRPMVPVALRHATRIGLKLQPVVSTKGNSESLGVVADVDVWKCRSGLSGHVVGRVWIRPLHTLLVSETKGGRAR
jgi:hypothetical protein